MAILTIRVLKAIKDIKAIRALRIEKEVFLKIKRIYMLFTDAYRQVVGWQPEMSRWKGDSFYFGLDKTDNTMLIGFTHIRYADKTILIRL